MNIQETAVTQSISPTQSQCDDKVEIRVARSVAEVETLRESWKKWPGHRDSDIDFYLMIIDSYPEVLRPHVIALFRNGEPGAILIGRLERKRLKFSVGYLPVFRPWARCLTFVYGAIRGDSSPENTEILLREVLESLKRREADTSLLEFVNLESTLYRLALNLPSVISRDSNPASQLHDLLMVPDNIEAVYRNMSSSRRETVRRRMKRLRSHSAGELKVLCYRDKPSLDLLFKNAEVIARKTYQRGLYVGFADTPEVRRRLELGAQNGWLRAYILYLGDRPCAFWIGMLYGRTFVSEYLGYDPEFGQFSPGMVLIMHVIDRFCGRLDGEVSELDFGLGHAEYKAALCSKSWLEASVFIFSPTFKGFLLKTMRVTTKLADRSARRVLLSAKLFPKLKRAWRDHVAKGKRVAGSVASPTPHLTARASPPEST